MKLVYHLSQINKACHKLVGGKAWALAIMAQQELPIPKTLCIPTNAYNIFMDETGLRAQVLMEYHRKQFDQMRWEEMWDCSLRIQNMFSRTPIPSILAETLAQEITKFFNKKAVAVRSSAVGEDSARASFAGLHESYLNIKGPDQVLEHIKLVWASTWSDAAILYRKEIGLNVEKSSMAVVIQELVQGQKSGVIFGQSPVDHSKAIIEAVYGLNQGLVDGTVEPDRWVIERNSGQIVSHTPALRNKVVVPASRGVKVTSLTPERRNKPPLTRQNIKYLFKLEKRLAEMFGSDQDVEWTYNNSRLRLLQSRPITTTEKAQKNDERQWYLSLRRGFENLVELRSKIEDEIIPEMVFEAESLKKIDLKQLKNEELANEISRRENICEKWKKRYWDFCIPFAHGIRLFGMFYNRAVKPEDPYEFMELLAGTTLKSIKRNEKLQRLATKLKKDESLLELVRSGKLPEDSKFAEELATLAEEILPPTSGIVSQSQLQTRMIKLLIEMAETGLAKRVKKGHSKTILKKRFLASIQKKDHKFALHLLDLARTSYRLRDDDNIYLEQIDKQLFNAIKEAHNRSTADSKIPFDISRVDEIAKCLRDPNYKLKKRKSKPIGIQNKQIMPRQLIGQPAGPGFATGPARVIRKTEDLFSFKKGEVIVCDAIDPNMTFIITLASAIIERRGGMLIHGAIIAREYGLPCVTGIPDADKLINTEDQITIDGYLGIVTISKKSPNEKSKTSDK
ncbi:MAG: PEP/pyruvate-binding domain-containing protein [Phycisphaerales bacterium]|jgi:pyruvate,water dikinase